MKIPTASAIEDQLTVSALSTLDELNLTKNAKKITPKQMIIKPLANKHQSFNLAIFLIKIDGRTKIKDMRREGTLEPQRKFALLLSVKKHKLY